MRLSNFINTTLPSTVNEGKNHAYIQKFSGPDFKDGWEIWLQCQSFVNLPDANYEYERGTTYPNSAKKCDFLSLIHI